MPSPRIALSDSLELSRLVAGVMKWGVWGHDFDRAGFDRLIRGCLDQGVTTFDHADIYGHYTTEAAFGEVLRADPGLRDRLELVTKCGIRLTTPNRPANRAKAYEVTADYIRASVEQSLKNLHTDRIDLLLIHRPSPLLHPDEVAETVRALIDAGKVLHFGVSNFTPGQFALLHDRIPLLTNQIECSALHDAPLVDGTLDQCLQHRIRPMAWSPLGGGAYFGDAPSPAAQRLRALFATLRARYAGATDDQLLLAWLLRHPAGILPVLGTGKLARIEAAVAATAIELDSQDWFLIWEAARGHEAA